MPFGERDAGGQRQQRRRASPDRHARARASSTTETYKPLPGGENHDVAAASAAGGLRVGDDDGALASPGRRAGLDATSLVDPVVWTG